MGIINFPNSGNRSAVFHIARPGLGFFLGDDHRRPLPVPVIDDPDCIGKLFHPGDPLEHAC